MGDFDVRSYVRQRLQSIEREFVWHPGVDDAWKAGLRSRLVDCIGLPSRTELLDVEYREPIDKGDYTQQAVVYSTRPGLRAFAYLLIPKDLEAAAPAVICVPGHGDGVDAIVGEAPGDYQNGFAIQCVRSAFITLAIEPIGFGHRMFEEDSNRGSSCQRDSMAALMLGETMIGWRCYDAMVSLDLLLSLAEVDSDRIAIMGISGGGLVAFWTACLDERFAACVVSGYFNTFFDSILSIDHCVDNFAPGLAKIVEMPDMAALICPRKLFVESGSRDPIFPASAFLTACQTAREIYADAEASSAFESDLFEDEHVFSGEKAIPKLREWFGMGA